ncbi:hypothetical protein ACFSUS_04550 [Spirosoma soli]|uniref:Uncharacterized protein n=1 Tax=Spirosoma soli TaxID=1770529 RepID=A0ABW5M0P9_9BACT
MTTVYDLPSLVDLPATGRGPVSTDGSDPESALRLLTDLFANG